MHGPLVRGQVAAVASRCGRFRRTGEHLTRSTEMKQIERIANGSVRPLQHWLSVVLLATTAVAFGISSAAGATLDEIKKRGYMIVATEDDYPPFEYVVNGKPMGYDHALLAILRKQA